jgi:hypothetical protein
VRHASALVAPAATAGQRRSRTLSPADRCRRKFLRYFPRGFADPTYVEWERGYKWAAHERWEKDLGQPVFSRLLRSREYAELARRAATIESRTNLLFSFEKMALRDAVRSAAGARRFAHGLYAFLYGPGTAERRFDEWVHVVASLPRRQTRVLTWPLLTVFGFIARPDEHIFLKPVVTRRAATAYGFALEYHSRPTWQIYQSVLAFAQRVRRDQRALHPRDMIDLQSFIWVQGSDEYPD